MAMPIKPIQILPVGIFVNLRFLILRNVRRSEFQTQVFVALLADLLPDGDLVVFPVNSYGPTILGCFGIVGITDERRSAVVFLFFAHLLFAFFFIGFEGCFLGLPLPAFLVGAKFI